MSAFLFFGWFQDGVDLVNDSIISILFLGPLLTSGVALLCVRPVVEEDEMTLTTEEKLT